ncbi:MAG: hypothetical protein QM605_09165, partial [Sphingobium sp.]
CEGRSPILPFDLGSCLRRSTVHFNLGVFPTLFFVMPAEAGISLLEAQSDTKRDPSFRWDDEGGGCPPWPNPAIARLGIGAMDNRLDFCTMIQNHAR